MAEEFVVTSHFAPAVLEVIDRDQFGAIPKSSTTQALVAMVHQWLEATDGTGTAVCVVLFVYRKSFDLMDHKILVKKYLGLLLPVGWCFGSLTFLPIANSVLSYLQLVSQIGSL